MRRRHRVGWILAPWLFAGCAAGVGPPASRWFRDADGDGHGDPSTSVWSPTQPSGYVAREGDCDDARATVHPDATEACNGRDDDCNGTTDDGWILIPGGTFQMGKAGTDAVPVHAVTLSPYCIQQYEVTVGAWRRCRDCTLSTYCGDLLGRRTDALPITCALWDAAEAYCQSIGGRLPTEAEWEYAARGSDGRDFPWGNESPSCGWANFDAHDGYPDPPECPAKPLPVGSFPRDRSPFGLFDMAGNASEWVRDWYGSYPAGAVTDPTGPPGAPYRTFRGGRWVSGASSMWLFQRYYMQSDLVDGLIGFRCAAPAP